MRYAGRVKNSARACVLISAATLATTTFSQESHAADNIELDVTAGYRFGGTLRVEPDDDSDDDSGDDSGTADGSLSNGRLTIEGAPSFGGIVSYRFQQNGFIYFNYSRQQATARFQPDNLADSAQEADVSVEYFQFGGNLEASRGRFTPYFGFSLGMGRFASLDTGDANLRFSMEFDGGAKIKLLDFLHLRLLGRMPITIASGSVYCISGFGCLVTSTGSPLVQGEVQAGLGLTF